MQLRVLGTPPPPAKTLSQAAPPWLTMPLVQPKQSCVELTPEETQPEAVGTPSCDERTSSSVLHMCAVGELPHAATFSHAFFAARYPPMPE